MLSDSYDYRFTAKPGDLELYLRMIPTGHRLVLAGEVVDFKALQAELEAGYCPDKGQPSIPPLLAFKLELLKYWYNLGDRTVLERSHTDVSFRYFLGIPINCRLPSHTLLTRFRGRMGEQGYLNVFQKIVKQAREHGLIKDKLRLKDATHVLANISIPSTLGLISQLRDRLIRVIEVFDPQAAEGFRISICQVRERTKDHPDSVRLQERLELLQDIVTFADQLVPDDSSTKAQRQRLVEAIALANKVLVQDTLKGAKHKTRSAVDGEAFRGKHGQYYDGYVLDVAMDADSELVTAINVLPAGGNEAQGAVDLVEQEHQHQENQVESLSIDGAGYNGPMIRQLEDPQGKNVTVFVPPKQDRVDVEVPASEFELTDDGQQVRCPQGHLSKYQQKDGDGTIFRFAASTCQGCPLAARCTPKLGNTNFGRSVRKNDYEPEYLRVRQRAQTDEFREVRKRHPAIERKLNEIVNHHGGREARYWGRAKVAVQQYGIGTAVNIKRMIKLMTELCVKPIDAANLVALE